MDPAGVEGISTFCSSLPVEFLFLSLYTVNRFKYYPTIDLPGEGEEEWGSFSDGKNGWTESGAVSSHFSSFNYSWNFYLEEKEWKKKHTTKVKEFKHTFQDEKTGKEWTYEIKMLQLIVLETVMLQT